MKLKYVGAKPIISQHGVSFDQKEQDSYTLLSSTIELLEALSVAESSEQIVDLRSLSDQHFGGIQLMEMLKKHCEKLEEIFEMRESKTEEMIEKYTEGVKANSHLTNVERDAWLGNIRVMRNYYMQFITNEYVYKSALNALADIVIERKIKEIDFKVGRNFGFILADLQQLLLDHKLSLDAKMIFEEIDDEPIGRFVVENHVPHALN